MNLYISSHQNGLKPVYSKSDYKVLLQELKSFPKKYRNNDYYLKILEINILIQDFTSANEIINFIDNKKNKYKFNLLILQLYKQKKDFNKAISLASDMGLMEKAECYLYFRKYNNAAESFIAYLNFPERRIVDSYLIVFIAESFFGGAKYEKALEYIEKNINSHETQEIHVEQYYKSLNLKGRIHAALKEYKKSIACFEQAYYAIKDNNEKSKYTTELEQTILNLISVKADWHIYWIKEKIKSYEPFDEIIDLNDYDIIVGEINRICHFNTQPKIDFKRFCKELIALNKNKEKSVKAVERKIIKTENECHLFRHNTVEQISHKAIIKFPDNEDILFNLAYSQYKLKKYTEALNNFKRLILINNLNLEYYNYIALIYKVKKQLNAALKYIKKCVENSECHSQSILIYENFLRIIDEMIQHNAVNRKNELLRNEAEKVADDLMKKIIISDSNPFRLSSSGINEIHNMDLFKYKPFNNYTIDSMINSYLFFSTLNQLNDPFDLPFLYSDKFKLYKDYKINGNDIKIFCSSLEENNTLMWSHYADSHKGLCIGYKIKSLPCNIGWDKIKYVHHNLSHERLQKEDDLITIGLYSKNSNWSYEKEVRLICYKEKTDCFQYAYPILPKDKSKLIEAYITQIIIGYKFPETQLDLLIHVLKDLNKKRKKHSLAKIKLHRITLDKEKPFNLSKETMNY